MPRHRHRHPRNRDLSHHPPHHVSMQPLTLLVLGLFVLGFAIALLRLLLPFLVLGGMGYGVWKFWQWRQQRSQEQEAAQQARQKQLDLAFYRLVQQHRGELSVLDFAMATQSSAEVAKQFLDRKAIEFDAQFKTTAEGQVLYCFYSQSIAAQPASFPAETGLAEE